MFDDLDQIDWAGLHAEQAPQWIKGLVSENQSIRNQSFDEMRDSYIYERPDLACFVIPYILRILEHQEVNSDTELLIVFLKNIRINAGDFFRQGIAAESSKKIIADIDSSIELYRRLSAAPLARDAALDLISEIENEQT